MEYPDSVRYVYHHFPDRTSRLSMIMAESLEIAGEQESFWNLHHILVLDTPSNMDELYQAAGQAGLDLETLQQALNAGEHTETVLEARNAATEHGVKHTAMFINQTEFTSKPNWDNLKSAINTELERIESEGHESNESDW